MEEPAKLVALLASILSLVALFRDAFFIPATTWPDRLIASASGFAIAFAVCALAGYIFAWADQNPSAWSTLPVKLLLWGSAGFVLALIAAWYFETQVLPLSTPAR